MVLIQLQRCQNYQSQFVEKTLKNFMESNNIACIKLPNKERKLIPSQLQLKEDIYIQDKMYLLH